MSKPKILLYDLETTPSLGYTWGKYEQTVLKFVKHRELLSVSWKWVGSDTVHCDTRQGEKTDKRLAGVLRDLLEEADISVAHNGNKFDKRIARTRMIANNLKPTKALVSVDTLQAARSYFDFNGNSLSDLCAFFGIGNKYPHPGLEMWLGCMADEARHWATMVKYNKHDIYLLSRVYDKLRAWIENHPNVARLTEPKGDPKQCVNCQGFNTQKRGKLVSLSSVKQRMTCQDCGKNYSVRYVGE